MFHALREHLIPNHTGSLHLATYAIILTALITFALSALDLPLWRYYGTILALSVVLVLNVLWNRLATALGTINADRVVLTGGLLFFLLANYLGINPAATFTFLPFILFMLAAQGIVSLGMRSGLLYTAAATVGWLVVLWLRGASLGNLLLNLISISAGLVFTVLMSWVLVLFQREKERAETLAAELRRTNQALEAARERERELAAAEERVRLAHDIHDGIGHHLAVLNVQLQAADKLISRDPERAAAALALSRSEAQAAIAEVRRSVAAMRRAPLDGQALPETLAALVRDFDRASPLTAQFTLHGEPQQLGPAATMTIYRAAQEGLTNAQKHAAATVVQVELRYTDTAAHVRVSDNGTAQPADPANTGGFGLVGLRERAERLGGHCTAQPQADGGFLLDVCLPLSAPATDQGGRDDPHSTRR
jgi:signal transduction histidine kinase